MRINNAGHYEYCRWADKSQRGAEPNIVDVAPLQYFKHHVSDIRQLLINGQRPSGCAECAVMEQHGKISGRQRQLLKIGVRLEHFDKSLASSPWVPIFTAEHCDQTPQDWQIDLGNYCNSACVFCSPHSSSRLAQEWQRIGIIDQLPKPSWADDPVMVDRLIAALTECKHIQYLHFIGGETVITPAFKVILQRLIDHKLNVNATIGFTTNLTVWDQTVVDLLTQFRGVNLGVSVESFDDVNDYVRWLSKIAQVRTTLDRWLDLAKQHNWLVQLRITPTIFTISKLLSVYDFAWQNQLAIESCNFLQEPAFMRPSVLPVQYRQSVINSMQRWIDQRGISAAPVVNTRDPTVANLHNVQDLQSYVTYLADMPDESFRMPELVQFIKRLESSRGNCVLDYLPDYDELFRSAGY